MNTNEMNEEIDFVIATNPEYYGDGATDEDILDFIKFAREYLTNEGYDVTIETVEHYSSWKHADQDELREAVWQAWLRSHRE